MKLRFYQMKQIESFFLGMLAAMFALVLEVGLLIFVGTYSPSKELNFDYFSSLNYLIILAAFIEEGAKYIVIAKRVGFISYGKSVITNSMIAGLGFAAVEGALIYSQKIPMNTGYSQGLIQIALLHILTAGIIGYFIATRNPKKISTLAKAVGFASAGHLAFNALAIYQNSYTNFFSLILLGILAVVNFWNFKNIDQYLRSK